MVKMSEEKKKKLAFKIHHKQIPTTDIIYADFEALRTKVEGSDIDLAT